MAWQASGRRRHRQQYAQHTTYCPPLCIQGGFTLNYEYLLHKEKALTDLHETKRLIHTIPLSQTICALLLISDPTLMAAMQKPRFESTHKAITETSLLTI